MNALPDKLFFKIGEVADLVGVKPHVLRYWESEFGCLRPMKTRGAHRQYRRRDVELAIVIRQLLHEQGYTISGARKRLRELGHDRGSIIPEPKADDSVHERATLLALRKDLTGLLAKLDSIAREEAREEHRPREVIIQAAVPVAARARPPS
jgi:DNA-binding transcriptional MerR regulator